MKTETLIYDALKRVIPRDAHKTVLFANVGQTSYEVQFFSLRPNSDQYQQCFQLAEKGELDANILDIVFAKIAEIAKADSRFENGKINICTVVIDKTKVSINFEHYEKSERIFQIKKKWKAKYLV